MGGGMNSKDTKFVVRKDTLYFVVKLQIRIFKVSNTQQKLIYKLGMRNMKITKSCLFYRRHVSAYYEPFSGLL